MAYLLSASDWILDFAYKRLFFYIRKPTNFYARPRAKF